MESSTACGELTGSVDQSRLHTHVRENTFAMRAVMYENVVGLVAIAGLFAIVGGTAYVAWYVLKQR